MMPPVSHPESGDPPGTTNALRSFVVWRALPALAGFLLIFLGAVALLTWSALGVDRIVVARETRMFDAAINRLKVQLPRDQESVTIWDDVLDHLAVETPEATAWLDENIVTWMADYFDHDEIYVLDGTGRALFVYRDGGVQDPADYASVENVIAPLAERLRARLRAGDKTGIGPHMQTIGEVDLATLNGHPAIVSVKPIVPSSDLIAPPPSGQNPLHVSVLHLDGAALGRLEQEQGFTGLRYVADEGALRHGMEIYPLRSAAGTRIGAFLWSPLHPGDTIVDQILPALGIIFILGGVGVVAGLMLLYQRTRGEDDAREVAHRLAFSDMGTGLPNRAALVQYLSGVLARLPEGGPVGVIHVDLERFKLVNETLGRDAGDAILRAFAARLSAMIQPDELVARTGGDEFIVVVRGRRPEAVQVLTDRLVASARKPFLVDGNQVLVGVYVGFCVANEATLSAEECLRRADVARNQARGRTQGRSAVFKDDMDVLLKERRETEQDLHRALARDSDEITVFFQPVFDLAGGHVVSAEALVRWHHPVRGWIAPDSFIPVAENAELIGPLGARVLRTACAVAAGWPGQTVAVNASPRELADPDYPVRVAEALAAAGLAPARLQIEVTETAVLEAAGQTERTLNALRGLGVSLAIDDFGTGFSSLSRLRSLDVALIKIDRSFITEICESAADRAIVQAIVDMAHAAGLSTTVEGVETAEQGALLRTLGCDHVQGFFYARPMPAAAANAVMQRGAVACATAVAALGRDGGMPDPGAPDSASLPT